MVSWWVVWCSVLLDVDDSMNSCGFILVLFGEFLGVEVFVGVFFMMVCMLVLDILNEDIVICFGV